MVLFIKDVLQGDFAMTMIAMQENKKFPMLIGDLLFSSQTQLNTDFVYPSFNIDIDLPIAGNRHPFRMIQKTYIVHPQVAVVVAGGYGLIKSFISKIKNYFCVHAATIDNLDSFVASYSFSDNEAYGICLADLNNSGFQYRYIGNWLEREYPTIGKIRSAASGSLDFLKQCDSFNSSGILMEANTYGNAIANICMLLSTVLGSERYFADDIEHAWGAGFEITVFDYSNNQFTKVDNLNHIIWKAKYNMDTGIVESIPLSVMTYKYINDVLSITSHIGKTPTMYVVLPIYIDRSSFDTSILPTEPIVDADRICNIYQVEIEGKDVVQPVCVFIEDNTSPQIIFLKYENNRFMVYSQSEYGNILENNIREWAKSHIK